MRFLLFLLMKIIAARAVEHVTGAYSIIFALMLSRRGDNPTFRFCCRFCLCFDVLDLVDVLDVLHLLYALDVLDLLDVLDVLHLLYPADVLHLLHSPHHTQK